MFKLIYCKANPHGLVNRNNISTAHDQALLSSIAFNNQ